MWRLQKSLQLVIVRYIDLTNQHQAFTVTFIIKKRYKNILRKASYSASYRDAMMEMSRRIVSIAPSLAWQRVPIDLSEQISRRHPLKKKKRNFPAKRSGGFVCFLSFLGLCLVLKFLSLNFTIHLSHQIFYLIHGVLNVGK